MSLLFVIRPMQVSDLAGVLALQAHTYPAHYREPVEVFASKLQLAPCYCLVAEKQQQLYGYLFAHPWPSVAPPALFTKMGQIPATADSLFIHDLALHSSCRGQSLGQRLLQACLRTALQQGLQQSTLVAVEGAEGFWLRQGYRHAAIADGDTFPGVYGATATFMQRSLQP